uniref:HVA22-like protein n=1 Tax=Rhizophora mucronata TaxID=61149 RepID=A0A2P2IVP6_RHIMU
MYGELKLAFVIYLWYPKTKVKAYDYKGKGFGSPKFSAQW